MRFRYGILAAISLNVGAAAFAQTPAPLTVTNPTLKANETVPVDGEAKGSRGEGAKGPRGEGAERRRG